MAPLAGPLNTTRPQRVVSWQHPPLFGVEDHLQALPSVCKQPFFVKETEAIIGGVQQAHKCVTTAGQLTTNVWKASLRARSERGHAHILSSGAPGASLLNQRAQQQRKFTQEHWHCRALASQPQPPPAPEAGSVATLGSHGLAAGARRASSSASSHLLLAFNWPRPDSTSLTWACKAQH